MARVRACLLCVFPVAMLGLASNAVAVECSGVETPPWINEIDYDDFTGFPNDDRQEFLEIAGPAGTSLAGYRVLAVEGNPSVLVCGTGLFTAALGDAHFDLAIPAGATIPDDGNGVGYYVVCFANTSTSRSAQCDVVLPAPFTDSNLKNGKLSGTTNECPDGVLLLDAQGGFVDAVAWEGLMPNAGDWGGLFQSPQYNAGRDGGFTDFESLYKNSNSLARATSGTEWSLSGGGADTAGAANPGQSLVCATVADSDGDGVADPDDNCPSTANPAQTDTDGDGVGDACNDASDGDGDEWADALDNCPSTANPAQTDTDGDGMGDACNDASDADGDEWSDLLDNCPAVANAGQLDGDADLVGDACDNCPADPNPGQEDADSDGLGDVCDTSTEPPAVPMLPGVGLPVLGLLLGGIGLRRLSRSRRDA